MDWQPASVKPEPTKKPFFTKFRVPHPARVGFEVISLLADLLRQAGSRSGVPGGDFAQPLHEEFRPAWSSKSFMGTIQRFFAAALCG
jgi:hypothetical protein